MTIGLWLAALGTLAHFVARRHRFVVLWVVTVAAAMVTTAIDAAGNPAFSLTANAGANDLAVASLRMAACCGAPRIVVAASLDVRNGSELHVASWKLS